MNKQQLAARIWASANEMRSKIEASEYKDYILGFIFYKFLSEKEETWLRGQGFEEADMLAVTEDDPGVVGHEVRVPTQRCLRWQRGRRRKGRKR